MTATAVAPLALGDPARYAALAAGLALVVGAICLLGGLVRAGSLADLLSQPVLVGYMAGIAVIMIVSQLGKVTGVHVDGDSPLAEVASFLTGLGAAHLPTVALALPLLVGILVGHRLRPTWPIPMIGMIAATAVVAAFSLDDLGVRLVGSAASGLPVPGLPALVRARRGLAAAPRPSASRSSPTRTTCSPPAPSRRAAARPSTAPRSSSPSAPPTSAAACCAASR